MGNKRNSVAVRDLVTNGYQTLSNAGAKLLFEHISNQMSHIQVRPLHDTDKVRPDNDDMKVLEAEMRGFKTIWSRDTNQCLTYNLHRCRL